VNRSLTIQKKKGLLPWRAHPGPDTTVGELESALSLLSLDLVRTTEDEILLVQTQAAIRDGVLPPDTEELAAIMFGLDAEQATLVEETGAFTKPTPAEFEDQAAESFDQEAQDRNAEGV